MKKILLIILILAFSITVYAQSNDNASININDLNNIFQMNDTIKNETSQFVSNNSNSNNQNNDLESKLTNIPTYCDKKKDKESKCGINSNQCNSTSNQCG